jgi:hypothetical protein
MVGRSVVITGGVCRPCSHVLVGSPGVKDACYNSLSEAVSPTYVMGIPLPTWSDEDEYSAHLARHSDED